MKFVNFLAERINTAKIQVNNDEIVMVETNVHTLTSDYNADITIQLEVACIEAMYKETYEGDKFYEDPASRSETMRKFYSLLNQK